MGEIYEKAALINIWLGRSDESSSLAWSKIRQVIENFVQEFQGHRFYDMPEFAGRHWDKIAALFRTHSGQLNKEALDGMIDLLYRPW